VNLSLGPFDWINPCGLQGVKMTSVEREIAAISGGPAPSMQEARRLIKSSIEEVFNIELDRRLPPSCTFSCLGLIGADRGK